MSHWTAARIWGGVVPDNDWTHISFMRDVRFRIRGVKHHRFRHRLDIRQWQGVPLTSPGQTFCHLARNLGLLSTEEGWTFVVVRAHELYEEPEELLQRLLSELREYGIPVPAVLSDELAPPLPHRIGCCLSIIGGRSMRLGNFDLLVDPAPG